jgi:hypothetical protein
MAAQHVYFLKDSTAWGMVSATDVVMRKTLSDRTHRGGTETRMSIAFQINIALWGMIICSAIEVAYWLHPIF